MKWFISQWVDGSMDTLTNTTFRGLSCPDYNSMNNLILKTVRGYIRLTHAHLFPCDRGLDVVAAAVWLKQRRSHLKYSGQMNAALENFIFHAVGL